MIYVRLFLTALCVFAAVSTFLNAQSLASGADITFDQQSIPQYLKDLEEQGYCVIPYVFSDSEAKILYERVWHEFIEKAWPYCRLNDRSNWKDSFPIHNKMGIFAGPAGQTQVMWDLRQDERVINVFANVWSTKDLIVSMDGLSFMCPPEIRDGYVEPWPHVDQAILRRQDGVAHSNNPPIGFLSESLLKTQPYTIQGQFLFEDSFEGDGGFYCIPKSHLRFTEFAPKLEMISEITDGIERKKIRTEFLENFFANNRDEFENPYSKKHITAPRGSIILWDSRTIHWNQHASKNRSYNDNPKIRMVGYLCYVPRARLTTEGMILRREAFNKGVSTGHNPAFAELKYTKDHINQDYIQYLEDPAYVQPKINLSSIGKSLLGQ
jgi:hypothetical protein